MVWHMNLSGNYVPRTPPYQGTTFPDPLLIRELRSPNPSLSGNYVPRTPPKLEPIRELRSLRLPPV
jgi:hypothetical protein